MQNLLRPYAKATLLEQLKAACEMKGIEFPGRICHRNKNALICFIWDNFPDFPRGFTTFPNVPMSHPDKRLRPANTDEGTPAAGTATETAETGDSVPLPLPPLPPPVPPVPPLFDDEFQRSNNFTWEWNSQSNPFTFNLWDDTLYDE
jgi:hypothetical protein